MTEDLRDFVKSGEREDRELAPKLPRALGWHLSDDDLSVIDALHAICIEWLAFASDAKSARNIATMMEALESIASGGLVSSAVELTVTRKPEGSDGLSATIQLSPEAIQLSTTEWVWITRMSPEQGHDHAWTLRAELTPRGGFAHNDVDHWFFLSDFVKDGGQTEILTSQSLIQENRYAD